MLFGGGGAALAAGLSSYVGGLLSEAAPITFGRANEETERDAALSQMDSARLQARSGAGLNVAAPVLGSLGAAAIVTFIVRFPWMDL